MKTDTITIFSDYYNELPDFTAHMQNLYGLRDIVGGNNFFLGADGTLQVMHYVGFFQKGTTRVQILPKIYSKTDLSCHSNEEVSTSMNFIYRLLAYSEIKGCKELDPQFQNSSQTDLLEIFIELFISQFIKLFGRKIHRNYIPREENQPFIKGKILFSETIRRNPILKHLHYIRYDEYTINNLLNQIFKSLILELLTKTKSSTNKRKLVTGLTFLQEVDLIQLNAAVFREIRFDRLNAEFEPLFNLAKLFFYNSQPGLSEGREKTFSFLVPLHKLFEKFVGDVLNTFCTDEFTYCYHPPYEYLAKSGKDDHFRLEPDFTILHKKKVITILDTKFKFPGEKGKLQLNEHDIYQLCTYALRYGCNSLFLIYPKFMDVGARDALLGEFDIQSVGAGIIKLSIIEVDIMGDDVTIMSQNLKKLVEPKIDSGSVVTILT